MPMKRFINIALVLLNTILAWAINQFPARTNFSQLDSYILALTGVCLLLIIMLTLVPDSSPSSVGKSNWAWLSSAFLFLAGGVLFLLIKLDRNSNFSSDCFDRVVPSCSLVWQYCN